MNGEGGTIWNFGAFSGTGTATILNCTFSQNEASWGSSIANEGVLSGAASVEIGSSILANSTSGPYIVNFGGTVTSLGYNLSDNATGPDDGTTDLLNTDPLLGPLQDNGGPTFTHALLAGSPAIDAGDPVSPVNTDQRGSARPVNGRIDIGAVELAAPVAVADTLTRPNTTPVAKVLKSGLLGNDLDGDGDPLTITTVGNATPAGATVVLLGNFVVYTAPSASAGNGSFSYTVSDGRFTSTATVTVTETTPAGPAQGGPSAVKILPSGPDFIVTFIGVPGNRYRVQHTTSSAAPYLWREFDPPAIHTAPANTVFTHTDVAPAESMRLYRAVANP